MDIDKRGIPVFARTPGATTREAGQEGVRMREYYAAHCPMTMTEAYEIWAGDTYRPSFGDAKPIGSPMSFHLRQGKDRLAFFDWWAMMRFEYAEAMMKANRESLED